MTKSKSVKLSTLTPNPDNPRTITDAAMSRLVKSVSEFTKMLEIRPIVYDENRVIIGGNMRYLALQRLGYEEVPEQWVRCADNLTDEEKRRFVILDNGETFGDWDFDALANAWDDLPLADLGVDLPGSWLEDGAGEDGVGVTVPEKDPNIIVRLSFHPGLWIGKREEINNLLETIKKTYNCQVKVDE